MGSVASQFIQRTYQQPYRSAVTRRSPQEKSAEKMDVIDSYNNFIWALARKFTNSGAEAEAAAKEIFADIQRFAEGGTSLPSTEDRLVARVALRRLLMFLE